MTTVNAELLRRLKGSKRYPTTTRYKTTRILQMNRGYEQTNPSAVSITVYHRLSSNSVKRAGQWEEMMRSEPGGYAEGAARGPLDAA